MKSFYSIFPYTGKVELMKPNGLIPRTLYNDFGYNTTIVTYNNADYNDKNIEGVNIKLLRKITGKPSVDVALFLIKNSKKIDIMHTFFWNRQNYLWISIYKLLNPKGKIYITMDADERAKVEKNISRGIKGKIKRFFLKKCDLISTETKDMYKWFKKNWYDQIKYVPYGVLPSKREINYCEKENIIITVGRIGTYQKATEILMEAYKKINDKIPKWKVKVIGPIEEEFKEQIEKFYLKNPNLKNNFEFVGPIFDRETLLKEYEKAKIFCLTSRYESFGLVLSEAASRGCYLVSTDIPPARDLTDNEKYGSLFKIDDSDKLANLLLSNCLNENKMEKNCPLIQKFINKHYTWNAVCKKALKYLGEEVSKDV